MSILITGASGFIGRSLASALLTLPQTHTLTLTDLSTPPLPEPRTLTPTSFARHPSTSRTAHARINTLSVDLTTPSGIAAVVGAATTDANGNPAPLDAVYLLHGLMSGASEADPALSARVNLDATRALLDALSAAQPGVRVVYTSSCAIYGPQDRHPGTGERIALSERDMPLPAGTYGAHKVVCEYLLADLARRGLVDARIVRLPTIVVRAGNPTGAASSFASGVFREPLQGLQAVLPVGREMEVWVCSARTVVRNLVAAGEMEEGGFWAERAVRRCVNLPGTLVTVGEMLGALEAVGGKGARGRVAEKVDTVTERIVAGWATRFDTALARSAGFVQDEGLEVAVKEFIEDYLGGKIVE